MKFYATPPEEQETTINIDYHERQVSCYTSRYAVYERLVKKLGEPTITYHTKKQISGASWTIPFSDRNKLKYIFSRPTIVGSL